MSRIPLSPLFSSNQLKTSKLNKENSTSAKLVPKYNLYKPPVLVTGKRWYIEYYYRVPAELLAVYNKQWERFRIIKDLNKHRTEEYANWLLETVTRMLDDGYSPFDEITDKLKKKKAVAKWSLSFGLDHFIEDRKSNELKEKSLSTYGTTINALKDYFAFRLFDPIEDFTPEDIEEFLKAIKVRNKLSNTTRNNYLNNTNTLFKYFIRKKIIRDNPCADIPQLKETITKHKYYDNKTFALVKKELQKRDPELYRFFLFTYYSCARPGAEGRVVQAKHILWERNLLFIPGQNAKNRKDDYIPMSDGLITLLKEMGADKIPGEYYIFGANHKPGAKPISSRSLQERFLTIRRELRLDEDYTIYAAKHTRGIHMAEDGANPYDIMKLMRHASLDMTMRYLRDLGVSPDDINKKSRIA